jgi:hypothetical protein
MTTQEDRTAQGPAFAAVGAAMLGLVTFAQPNVADAGVHG